MNATYEHAMEFASNYMQTHGIGLSNVYVVQKKDIHGNVIDEKYGMNLMTDYGMSTFFSQSLPTFPTKFYIGQGSGSISYDSQSLISICTPTPAINRDVTQHYDFPLYYHELTGIITCVSQFMTCYFDFNIDGVYGDISITEYGIGTDESHLWTHSWVYNNLGEQSTLTKSPNEQLEITVYLCMSYTKDLINTLHAQGKHVIITTMQRFYNHMSSNLYTMKRFGVLYNRPKSETYSLFQSSRITTTTNLNEITLTSGNTDDTGYIDGFACCTNGMKMYERAYMSPVCTFTNYDLIPDATTMMNPCGFSDIFGKNNCIPITQLNLTKSYTFNPSTGLYDLEDYYVNNPDVWYNETTLETLNKPCCDIYYTNNNTIQHAYVWVNMCTNDAITQFNPLLTTVYMTDEYWNVAKWIRIIDMTNVPNTCDIPDGQGGYLNPQKMRYIITNTDGLDLKPTRSLQRFGYVDSNGVNTYSYTVMNYPYESAMQYDSNAEYGWIARNQTLYLLNQNRTVTLSQNTSFHAGYQNMVLTIVNQSDSYVMTNASDSSPTPRTSSGNSDSIANLYDCYITNSKNGRVFVSDYKHTKAIKIDITNGTDTKVSDCALGCVLLQSTNYAYISETNHRTIYVKDFDQDTLVETITIDPSWNVPVLIFGFNDTLYISDCSTYHACVHITSGTHLVDNAECCAVLLDGNFAGDNRSIIRMDANGHYFVMYRVSDSRFNFDSSWVNVVSDEHPLDFKHLDNWVESYIYTPHVDLYRVNNGTVLLVMSLTGHSYYRPGLFTYALDLSRYLYDHDTTGSVRSLIRYGYQYLGYGENLVYGTHTVPCANLLPHKITGTSNTISTINSNKNIKNKSWSITVTNVSDWGGGGKPPGTRQ